MLLSFSIEVKCIRLLTYDVYTCNLNFIRSRSFLTSEQPEFLVTWIEQDAGHFLWFLVHVNTKALGM